MEIDTKRAQRLQAFLSSKDPEENMRQSIEIDGQRTRYQVYRIPLNLLIFNIRNGRFAAELLDKEKAAGRRLDSTKAADALLIREILLSQNPNETDALTTDLMRNGQADPGIVTFDGAVINANRRMAIFSKLYEDTQDSKYEYLLASVLPKGVTEKDLWRIEAGLQFAKDFRLEYGPINELLKLKEGFDRGLSAKEISASLLGRYSDKDVLERIEVLRHIETYLQSFNRKGDYSYIQQQRSMEKFNSLQGYVVGPLKKKKRDAKDILAVTNFAFCLIHKTPRSHWDVRKLSKIVDQPDAFKVLKSGLNAERPLETPGDKVLDAFDNATDIVDDREESDKPERLLKRALSAVESIDRSNSKLKTPPVQTIVQELKRAVERLISGATEHSRGKAKH